jgi:hypothetical protein
MRRFGTLITTAATCGLAALAYAQTSPPPGQPAPDPEAVAAAPAAEGATERSRLAELVPSDMSATEACSGFKSTTECAAALHAAQNVGVPFRKLKSKMTGGETLGAAIHDLKPGADVRSEVSRAEEQAKADLSSPQRSSPQG